MPPADQVAAPTVAFVYDVVCPYAYLASTQIDAVARRAGVSVEWQPVLLGGIYRALGAPQQPAASMSAPRARLNALDMLRQAERLGVPLRPHPAHPRRTVDAMRLCLAAPLEARAGLSRALFHAYWVENRDVSDPDVLRGIAAAHGVDADVARSSPAKQALFDAVDAAVARGVFGVPSFVVGERLIWGVDRLHLLEEDLSGRRPAPVPVERTGGHLLFFHDLSSPFSYLASTQVERIAARHGATLESVPILLGALFRSLGTPNVPILTYSAARQAHVRRDLHEHARWWGVPLRFPSSFPLRTVTPLRVLVVEPAASSALYRAAWAQDRDIGDDDVLRGVLDDAGFDGRALVDATRDPSVKRRLRDNTARAEAAGACGVPSFVVGGEVLFWGQDRLEMVEHALQGWRPAAG